jgi:predicted GIY-YIG superfamily endonuclease
MRHFFNYMDKANVPGRYIQSEVPSSCTSEMFPTNNFYTYIVASSDHQVVFVGVTDSLLYQLVLHWYDNAEAFSPHKRVFSLLWYKGHARASEAVSLARELKHMHRAQLWQVIAAFNPELKSLCAAAIDPWPPSPALIREALRWQKEARLSPRF